MLTMRNEQVQMLARSTLETFEGAMVKHLTDLYPKKAAELGTAELRQQVHRGIHRAQTYGVRLSADVRRFLECQMDHGEKFDSAPGTAWAGALLRDVGIDGTEKMRRISDYEVFSLKRRKAG